MTNTELLIETIEKSGLKYVFIAKNLDITPYSLQMKIENKTEFKASEIAKLSKLLDLTKKERDAIFLNLNLI